MGKKGGDERRPLFVRADALAVARPVRSVPRPAEQHAEYGIGSGKANEIFGYICPMSSYVRLGFYFGAMLTDPDVLLQGEGKRLRHVKVRSLAEAQHSALRRLVVAAVRERKDAQGRI